MDQIIKAWADRYGANVFYNFIEKEKYTECLLVVRLKDDVQTYVGSSKTVNDLNINAKPKAVAKILAQAAALNGYLIDIIQRTNEEENQVLNMVSREILDELEDECEDV